MDGECVNTLYRNEDESRKLIVTWCNNYPIRWLFKEHKIIDIPVKNEYKNDI